MDINMPDAVYISIVIPTRNRPVEVLSLVQQLVEQIKALKLEASSEVIVVDDGSGLRVQKMLENSFGALACKHVNLFFTKGQKGPSFARNFGAAQSKGSVVAFLDDDSLIDSDFFRQLIEARQNHPEASVMNGILKPARSDFYSQFWNFHYAQSFLQADKDFYAVNEICSGNFSIKRELLTKMNPFFDERLPAREDFDLSIRFQDSAVKIYQSNRIVRFNLCRKSLASLIKQRAWYGRGEYLLQKKYGPRLKQSESPKPKQPLPLRFWPLQFILSLTSRCVLSYEIISHEPGLKSFWKALTVIFGNRYFHGFRIFKATQA